MSNVERRVVEMRFDNQDFEKNVGQTLISLETLQKALQMQGGEKGLNNIAAAAKTVDMSNLEQGVQAVSDRFSTLGIIGMRVLQNLTDMAMRAVSRLGSTFLGPLFSGGKQRALNMGQAKFMFSGLGKTAKEIGSVGQEGTIMDNLYKSVEGTFYSLDKAALIGSQLMAAGVDYKTELTTVMKSIAGVASVYNMDYQRVGQLFTQIKAGNKLSNREVESFMTSGLNVYATIAEYLNSIGDGANYTQAQVKEMVTKGQIDFDTFTKAMGKFAAQAQKSKQLFSGAFEDMAAAMARIGEKLWKPILDWGQEFFNATVPLIDSISSRLTPFYNAFGSFIDALKQKTGTIIDFTSALFNLNETYTQLTNLYKLNDKDMGIETISADRLNAIKKFRKEVAMLYFDTKSGVPKMQEYYEAVKALYSGDTLDPKTQEKAAKAMEIFDKALADGKVSSDLLFKALGATDKEIQFFNDISGGAKSALELLKRGFEALKNALGDNTSNLRKVLDILLSIFAFLGRAITKINEITKESGAIKKFFSILNDGLSKVLDFISSLAVNTDKLKEFGGAIKKIFEGIKDFIKPLLGPAADKAKEFFGSIKDGLNFGNIAKAGGLAALSGMIWNLYKMITKLGEHGRKSGFLGTLLAGDMFNEARLAFINFQNQTQVMIDTIKADVLEKIGKALLYLAAAMFVMASVDSDKLTSATVAMGALLAMIAKFSSAMNMFSTFSVGPKGVTKTSFSWMVPMAAAILVLSGALKVLSGIDNVEKGLFSLGIILTEIFGFMKMFSELTKLDPKGFKKASGSVILLAVAIGLLMIPVKILSKMSYDELVNGLGGLGAILVELAGFMYLVGNVDLTGIGKASASMILLALAINLLMIPIKAFSKMDVEELKKGIGALAGILVAFGLFIGFMSVLDQSKAQMMSVGASMILIALAINLMLPPIKKLAEIDSDGLMQALLGLGVILVGMWGFFYSVSTMDPKTMLAGAASLVIAGIAVNLMARAVKKMGALGDKMWTGLVGLAGMLTVLTVALHSMATATDGVPGMLACAAAIFVMAPALKLLSTIPLGAAISGLVMLAGALTIFVMAAMAVEPVAGILWTFAGAIALLGVGILALGGGMMLLATTFATGIGTIVLGFKTLLMLIPEFFIALFQGLMTFVTMIGEAAPNIAVAVVQVISAVMKTLREAIPEIVDTAIMLISYLLASIDDNMGEFVERGISIVLQLIDGITEKADELVDAGIRLVEQLMFGIADNIAEHGPTLVNALIDILLSVLQVIVSYIPVFGDKAAASIEEYRKGLQSGETGVSVTSSAISDKASKNLEIDDQYANGKNAIQGLVDGMRSMLDTVSSVAATIGAEVDRAIRSKHALDEASPSKKLFQVGAYATEGLVNGMLSLRGDVESAATEVGALAADSLSSMSLVPDFNPNLDTSKLQSLTGVIDVQSKWGQELEKQAALMKQMEAMSDRLSNAISNQDTNHTFSFTIPFDVNGREFARATATYNQQELDRGQMLENRKLGII